MNDPYDNHTYPAYYDYGYDEYGDPVSCDDAEHEWWPDVDDYPYADEIEGSYDGY